MRESGKGGRRRKVFGEGEGRTRGKGVGCWCIGGRRGNRSGGIGLSGHCECGVEGVRGKERRVGWGQSKAETAAQITHRCCREECDHG